MPWTLPLEKTEPRLVLSKVCSNWRRIISYSASEFWCHVIIRLSGSRDRILLPFNEWLPRASTRLLNTSIYPSVFSHSGVPAKPVQDIVVPYSARFRRLNISLNLEDTCEFFTGSGSYPSLQELELVTTPRLENVQDEALLKETINFPALRRLTWTSKGNLFLHHMHFPWEEMTALHLQGICIDAAAALGVLRVCRSLEECTLNFTSLTPNTLTQLRNEPTVVLPVLRDANFGFVTTSVEFYPAVLSRFTLPLLRVLHIRCPDSRPPSTFSWSHQAYEDLSTRSSFTLERFHLTATHVNGDVLTSFKSMPSLRALTIKINRKDALPSWFVSNFHIGNILPNLEEMKVLLQDAGEQSASILTSMLSMVMSRQDYLSRISLTAGGTQSTRAVVSRMKRVEVIQPPSSGGDSVLVFDLTNESQRPTSPRHAGARTARYLRGSPNTSIRYVVYEPTLMA
ncbi:hypothetical protein AX16_008317 [Volvariella volvacea WC 439]|nr:hypothetical protein AX16_008317 [Volvariella volvacea WC 439]